jgi:hypothetical protein
MDRWNRRQLGAARELIMTLNRLGLVNPFAAFMLHGEISNLIFKLRD